MKKKPLASSIVAPATPELATKAHEGTPGYGDYGHPPAAAPLVQPDHRAEGGDVYDLSNEQTTL